MNMNFQKEINNIIETELSWSKRVKPLPDYLVKDKKQRLGWIIIFHSKEPSALQEFGFINAVERWGAERWFFV